MKCDLHIHTDMSDGILSPEAVVEMAKERGLDCISVTDHDTFVGTRRARDRAAQIGLKYVVGAELSTVQDGTEVHILAYNVDISDPELDRAMERVLGLRAARNAAMAQKLAEHGMPIDLDLLYAQTQGSVGRPVIARELVRLGYCESVAEAFEKFLGVDKSCYVQTRRLTPTEAIQLTLRFGGIPVLAHPKQLHMDKERFEAFLRPLVAVGLSGIEANYFAHNTNERSYYNRMAKKYRLVVTGGSDFHDYVHGIEIGTKSFSPNAYTRKVLGI